MKSGPRASIRRWFNEHNIIYAVILLAIILTCITNKFLTLSNIMNIIRQTSMVAIIAVGSFYIIVGGGIDLSSGAVVGISGIMFAKMIADWGINPILGILLTLIFGCLLGGINATMVAYGHIPPFIATLGMEIACRGLCFVVTNAYPRDRVARFNRHDRQGISLDHTRARADHDICIFNHGLYRPENEIRALRICSRQQ